jgi:hypothetical protein
MVVENINGFIPEQIRLKKFKFKWKRDQHILMLEKLSSNPNYPAWMKIKLYEKLGVFTVVKMLFVVFWFVMSCGLVSSFLK